MIHFILKDETRFWRIFRRLMIPVGIFAFLTCGMGAILTLTGANTVKLNDQPVPQGWGALVCIAAFPVFALVWTILLAPFAFAYQQVRSSLPTRKSCQSVSSSRPIRDVKN